MQAAIQLSMGGPSAATPAPAAAAPVALQPRAKPRTFSGKDPQDVLPPPSRSSAKKIRSEPRSSPTGADSSLPSAEVVALLRLLFGSRPEAPDVQRWLSVGFQFSSVAGTEWGLWQRCGGPCGVFAPVQAFILKQLLFDEADGANADATKRMEQPLALAADDDVRPASLAHALASMLYNATPASSYAVCQVSYPQDDGSSSATNAAQALAVGAGTIEVAVSTVNRIADVQQMLEEGLDTWLAGPCGVLSFVCMVLLSRTLTLVKEDMDDNESPLIGRFGHCNQELVNLMLIGEATSNVFDGSRWLGDDPSSGLLVRGVDSDRVGVPPIGFLSELEPMRYLAVGSLYKHPDCPVWVLGSATHYTVVFSTRKSDSQLSPEVQLEQLAKKVFMQSSIDEGGLALADSLSKLLEGMGISADKLGEAQTDLVREEIILWEDFRIWARKQFGLGDGIQEGASKDRLELFLYDGQDPPGPTLRSITVEANDIDPSLAGAELDAFTATLHTRWPNAIVTVKHSAGGAAK